MRDYWLGMFGGFAIFFVLQSFGWCGMTCREAYIQKAMKDHKWSKGVWEEIGKRIGEETRDDEQ